MPKRMKVSIYKAAIILILIFTASCVPVKQLSYFNDLDELVEPGINTRTQKLIMPFDRIYIKVNLNEKDTKNKISITELEKSMITALQAIGIDVKKVRQQDAHVPRLASVHACQSTDRVQAIKQEMRIYFAL